MQFFLLHSLQSCRSLDHYATFPLAQLLNTNLSFGLNDLSVYAPIVQNYMFVPSIIDESFTVELDVV